MGFFFFMLVMCLLLPVTELTLGKLFSARPPKDINWFYGYRTALAMRSQQAWDFAQKYWGTLCFRCGLISLASVLALLPFASAGEDALGSAGTAVIAAQAVGLVIPICMTQRALKQRFGNDPAAGSPAPVVAKPKGAIAAAVVICAVGGLIVWAVLAGGNYTVELTGEDFAVNAVMAPGVSVPLKDVASARLAADPPAGFKEFGYGTPSLLMGRFKNDEFGSYNRYTRPSCATAVILETNEGRRIVVNEPTEEKTKALYDAIIEKANIA